MSTALSRRQLLAGASLLGMLGPKAQLMIKHHTDKEAPVPIDFASGSNPPAWLPMKVYGGPSNPIYALFVPPTPNRPCQIRSVALSLAVGGGLTTLPWTGNYLIGPEIDLGLMPATGTPGTSGFEQGVALIDSQIVGQLQIMTFRPYRPYYLQPGQALLAQAGTGNPSQYAFINSGQVEWVQPTQQ